MPKEGIIFQVLTGEHFKTIEDHQDKLFLRYLLIHICAKSAFVGVRLLDLCVCCKKSLWKESEGVFKSLSENSKF